MQRRAFRIGLAAIVSLAAALVLPAYAAGLGIDAGGLGAAQMPVSTCDDDVSVRYAVDGSDSGPVVSAVIIDGIDGTCDGGTVGVTLVDAAGAELASGTAAVTAASTSATVALAMPVPVASVHTTHLALTS